MLASVDDRQFTHLESTFNGIVRPYKPGPHHRPDSPVRSSHNTFTHKKQLFNDENDSSSEDENETGYKEIINKGNNELEPSTLDSRDEGTADNWIARNSSMVRFTGKHPFNSEPPLTRLMHYGFITPVPLHYVCNHGAVPKATWDDWTVENTGLVKRPAQFTMDQLVNDFPSRGFPVTLVCAGNRRKEQNMVKQTIGFNWGAAGISTSVWRGVPLRDVLKRCGIFSRKNGALNVCFEGAEDLPGGGGSKYGTSIKKELAMDPSRDIILAYMQNGERLSPDHGFPVRMIIPGFIGGRMVKWLTRILVTTQESDNYYHYKDNRVLPSHVDTELANAEAWWYKPEYIINELNINSVIATPCHDEVLPISPLACQKPYALKGYAYSDFALNVPAELESALRLKTVQYFVIQRPWLDLYGVNVRPVAPFGSVSRKPYVDSALIHRCLPDELLFEVFARMSPYDMGRASCVCRKWRYTIRNPVFWRNACLKAWQPTGVLENDKILQSKYDGSWRKMWLLRPRIRIDGLYVSRNTYIRAGVAEWKITKPVHIVCYFRYLRFFSSGRFLYKNSPQKIKEVVKVMNFRASKGAECVFGGRYTLSDDKVEAAVLYPGMHPTVLRIRLRLRGTTAGANNRMDLLSLVTSGVNNDEVGGPDEDILGVVEGWQDDETHNPDVPAISHKRGLTPFVFVPFEEVETSVLNLPVEKMDYYVPG